MNISRKKKIIVVLNPFLHGKMILGLPSPSTKMVEMYWVKTYGMSTVPSGNITEKLHLDWVTMSGKVYWKTWALALLGSVSPVTEHVPQGYLEANFTG